MKLNFRTLGPDDVKVRVGTYTEFGVELLVFKNARVDANILDETVGPLNWACKFSPDLRCCEISVRDSDTGEWVTKSDAGDCRTYSAFPNKELASDAFKRSGAKWGIGRELYNLPQILVSRKTKFTPKGYVPEDPNDERFYGLSVSEMTFTKTHKCSKLVIVNADGEVVFEYSSKKGITKSAPKKGDGEGEPIKEAPIQPVLSFEDEDIEGDGQFSFIEPPLTEEVNPVKNPKGEIDPVKDLKGYVESCGGQNG